MIKQHYIVVLAMGTRRISTRHGDFTLFFTRQSPFSNFYPVRFDVEYFSDYKGGHFSSVEQYYMYNKALSFGCTEEAENILKEKDPRQAKIIGASLPYFDKEKWDKLSAKIMKNGLKAKFSQNDDLLYLLFLTKGSQLVECSPTDNVWGIGMSIDDPDAGNPNRWKGTNRLGVLMSEIRDSLWDEERHRRIREKAEIKIYQSHDLAEAFHLNVLNLTRRNEKYYRSLRKYDDSSHRSILGKMRWRSRHDSKSKSPKRTRFSSPYGSIQSPPRNSRWPIRDRQHGRKRHRSDSPSPSYRDRKSEHKRVSRNHDVFQPDGSHEKENTVTNSNVQKDAGDLDIKQSSKTPAGNKNKREPIVWDINSNSNDNIKVVEIFSLKRQHNTSFSVCSGKINKKKVIRNDQIFIENKKKADNEPKILALSTINDKTAPIDNLLNRMRTLVWGKRTSKITK